MFNFIPMNSERKEQEKIESLINEALGIEPELRLSPDFTDKLVRKVERYLAIREIFTEFAVKIAVVSGILVILLLCLFLPFLKEGNPFLHLLLQNRSLVLSVCIVLLFVFFTDQVLLRYFFRKQASHS